MRSASKLLVVSLSLVVALIGVDPNPARCQGNGPYEVASFNLQAYLPARILISYSYTNNFSVTDITSLGQTIYKINTGPTSIEFKAEDAIDRYTFTVEIKYPEETTQSIQIAVFSGSQPPEGIQFNVKGKSIVIRFVLTVSEQPQYPSPEEVAEQVVVQVANELIQFESRINEVIKLQNRNLETQWIMVGVGMAINMIIIVVFALFVRRGTVEVRG